MEPQGKREGWGEWRRLYQPVLGLLAVAAEPITAEWLADHVGQGAEPDEVTERVLDPWRRFLRRDGQTWRIIHQSFADFLREKLDLQTFHRRVSDYYRLEPTRWSQHAGYAHRHLSTHLRQAADAAGLFALVDDPAWYTAQDEIDPSGGRYLNDVRQAWQVAEAHNQAAVAAGRLTPYLGREVHCALIAASLQNYSANIPPVLLEAIIQKGVRPPAWGLAIVQQQRTERAQAETLAALAPHLSPPLLAEALAFTRTLTPARAQATALAALAPYLPPSSLHEVLSMSYTLDNQVFVWGGVAAPLSHLATDQMYPLWQETLRIAARQTREKLLASLGALHPVIYALGGSAAVRETAEAIIQVGRRWP
jgi:hypothetical protein